MPDRDRDRDSDRGGRRREPSKDRRDDPHNDGYTAMKSGDRRRDYEDLVHEISDDRRSDDRRSDRDRDRDRDRRRDGRDGRDRDRAGDSRRSRSDGQRRSPRDGEYHNGFYSFEEMQPVLASVEDIGITIPQDGSRSSRRGAPASPASVQSRNGSRFESLNQTLNSDGNQNYVTQYAEYSGFDVETWLQCAETGKLDVYTCLGLVNGTSFKKNRWKLIVRTVAALFIQMVIPILLLLVELDKVPDGEMFSLQPVTSDIKLRVIGTSMILFSLYALHGSCLDTCRSRMLYFGFEQRLPWAVCWPLLIGEFARIIVGATMLLTMSTCFSNASDGPSLVLNTVAFNFLGGMDAVFVDRESHVDAMRCFRDIMITFKYTLAKEGLRCGSRTVGVLTTMLRMCFIVVGIIVAIGFGILPARYDTSNTWKLPFHCTYVAPWLQ